MAKKTCPSGNTLDEWVQATQASSPKEGAEGLTPRGVARKNKEAQNDC